MIDRFLGRGADEPDAPEPDDYPLSDWGLDLEEDEFDLDADPENDPLGFTAGGGDMERVEERIEEFERRVGTISTVVETLESDNAELSEEVDEVRSRVRKLMEIYELMTRGVNPFVDDDGPAASMDEATMEVFSDGGREDTESEPSSVPTEPESDPIFGDLLVASEEDEEGNGAAEEAEDVVSFADLKAEYRAVDAAEGAEPTAPAPEEPPVDIPAEAADAGAGGDDAADADGPPSPDRRGRTDAPPVASTPDGRPSAIGEKPYLRTVPTGYAADLIVLRWMEYLTDKLGVSAAADTIAYYETVEWVSSEAADRLLRYLAGLGSDTTGLTPSPRSGLSIDEHTQSLQYIHRLATLSPQPVVLTHREDVIDDLVTTDVAYAATAVPHIEGMMSAYARGEDGPNDAQLPTHWVRAADRIRGGDRS